MSGDLLWPAVAALATVWGLAGWAIAMRTRRRFEALERAIAAISGRLGSSGKAARCPHCQARLQPDRSAYQND